MLSGKEAILLRYLRKNSRESLAKISRETNIPVSTLFDTLKRLESNVILKHVSLIDFSKIGYSLKVNFVIGSEQKQQLKEFLMQSHNVNTLFSLINKYDFYAECIFKEIKEMTEFKENLKKLGVDNIQETFIVDELKKEEFCL